MSNGYFYQNILGASQRVKGIIWTVAGAVPVLVLALSAEAHAAMDPAKAKACLAGGSKCINRCSQVYTTTDRINACIDRCIAAESKCYKAAENPGKLDTGGAPPNPKDASTTLGTVGVFNQPSTPGAGGSGPSFGSGGIKR